MVMNGKILVYFGLNGIKKGDSMKNYDIWFTLEHPANFVIEANSKKEAKEIAEELLAEIDDDELITRIKNAIDYMGLKIVNVERIN